MTTSPEPCSACGGSGRVVDVRDDFRDLPQNLQMEAGYGFYHGRCAVCLGHGEDAEVPEAPAFVPYVPPDFRDPPHVHAASGEIVRSICRRPLGVRGCPTGHSKG